MKIAARKSGAELERRDFKDGSSGQAIAVPNYCPARQAYESVFLKRMWAWWHEQCSTECGREIMPPSISKAGGDDDALLEGGRGREMRRAWGICRGDGPDLRCSGSLSISNE